MRLLHVIKTVYILNGLISKYTKFIDSERRKLIR